MAARKQMDLLTAVEQIVEKAKGTGLSSEFYRKADRPIKYMAEKMELTKEQSVMMALFVDNSSDTSISISDFGKFLDCRTTRILRYMSDIDVLEKRELVRCCRDNNSLTYRVPIEVIEAFKKDEMYVPKDCSGLSCQELFTELDDVFNMRESKELKYDATVEKIRHLFNCNNQLLFVQKVKSYELGENMPTNGIGRKSSIVIIAASMTRRALSSTRDTRTTYLLPNSRILGCGMRLSTSRKNS